MLARRYLSSVKNLPNIMTQITEGTAPKKFTTDHLKSIGFKSSNDRAILAVLKELGFLTDDGVPTQRYLDYRDQSRSELVMAEALREAYEEIFHINERPTDKDRNTIEGMFKSEHNVSNSVARRQASTFFALLKLADLDSDNLSSPITNEDMVLPAEKSDTDSKNERELAETGRPVTDLNLRYNVEVHLPATKDIEVYTAIFKSIKENLLDD